MRTCCPGQKAGARHTAHCVTSSPLRSHYAAFLSRRCRSPPLAPAQSGAVSTACVPWRRWTGPPGTCSWLQPRARLRTCVVAVSSRSVAPGCVWRLLLSVFQRTRIQEVCVRVCLFNLKPGSITQLLLSPYPLLPPRLLSPSSVVVLRRSRRRLRQSSFSPGPLPSPAASAPAPVRCVLLVPLDGQLEVCGLRFS